MSEMLIIDISNRSAPIFAGRFYEFFNDNNLQWNVFVSGSYAYVTGREFGAGASKLSTDNLYIINVSDPASPVLVSKTVLLTSLFPFESGPFQGPPYVQYNHAFVITGTAFHPDFTIYDTSDKANPVKIADYSPYSDELSLEIRSFSYSVSGTYAYLALHGEERLEIIDIGNPYEPTLVNTYEYSWRADLQGEEQ